MKSRPPASRRAPVGGAEQAYAGNAHAAEQLNEEPFGDDRDLVDVRATGVRPQILDSARASHTPMTWTRRPRIVHVVAPRVQELAPEGDVRDRVERVAGHGAAGLADHRERPGRGGEYIQQPRHDRRDGIAGPSALTTLRWIT